MTARAVRRHYDKAPIIEALIDIQIESEIPVSIDAVKALAEDLYRSIRANGDEFSYQDGKLIFNIERI